MRREKRSLADHFTASCACESPKLKDAAVSPPFFPPAYFVIRYQDTVMRSSDAHRGPLHFFHAVLSFISADLSEYYSVFCLAASSYLTSENMSLAVCILEGSKDVKGTIYFEDLVRS